MKRAFAGGAVVALLMALALPAGAKAPKSQFALAGEARALELAVGDQGVTLGLALSRGDSVPSALGVGAGQCAVLGDSADPNSLPCSDTNTEKSAYPGATGDEQPSCAASLPAPLSSVVNVEIACGSSTSGTRDGLPWTTNQGKVAGIAANLPVGSVLGMDAAGDVKDQVDEVIEDLTDALAPVLDQAPKQVKDAVEEVVDLIQEIENTKALAADVGPAHSNIAADGDVIAVDSAAAGARIGLVGVPSANSDGSIIPGSANPLQNGLVIIEVGAARASASVDRTSAVATSAASPALLTVKVRDITKPQPTYVEVTVAPGQTVTVLQGTPAESTISAASSSTEQQDGTALAAADAVRLHLLKGIQGGIKLGLGRATAAATAEAVRAPVPGGEEPPPPTGTTPQKRPPIELPQTGARSATAFALVMLLGAGGTLALRRRFSSR